MNKKYNSIIHKIDVIHKKIKELNREEDKLKRFLR